MAKIFKLRTKTSRSGVPKGLEFQVPSRYTSEPSAIEIGDALVALGYSDAKSTTWSLNSSYVELVK